MANTLHQEEVANSLGEETCWGQHEAFVVAVIKATTYNSTRVEGVVSILVPSCEADMDEWRESKDLDDLLSGDEIQTTSKGARVLAAALLRAADIADHASRDSDNR